MWWYNWFNKLDLSEIESVAITYSKEPEKWSDGYFEMHFDDILLYKN